MTNFVTNLTPAKFCLILVVIAMIVLTYLGKTDAKDFVAMAMLITGFYFGQPSSNTDTAGMGK